jgi:tetratricopeptide (TPR) repeat protein
VKLYYINETDHSETGIALALEAHEIREEAVRKGILEGDHPNRANGFMNLGVMYTKVNPEEAIRLHSEAIKIREGSTRFKNEQVQGLALNYLNIGRSYSLADKFDEAAQALRKCLEIIQIKEKACGYRFAL